MASSPRPSIHRGAPSPRRRGKAKRTIVAVLLLSALPVVATVVVLLLPQEQQDALLAKLPSGAGRWAIAAVIAFATMAILAWLVLPLLHHASGWLRGRWARLAEKPLAVRVLLAPVLVLIEGAWLLLQALFAVDAFLIILAAFLGLLFTLRIVEPGLLPEVARTLGGG